MDFLIKPWIPPVGGTEDPLKVLGRVVRGYEPGQGGVDGGGFVLVTETDSYLYYQFESLKKGYIDDLEFAKGSGSSSSGILVRSASRLGQTDFGVNAIRLNYIADNLRKEGWTIDKINQKSHPDYWVTSDEAREATFDKDRRNMS